MVARSIAFFATTVLLFTACSGDDAADPTPTVPPPTATASPAASPTPPPLAIAPLDWESCNASFECAEITLPLDYANEAAGTVTLPLIRRPATDTANRIGSMLVNPGGPGVSGVDFVRNAYALYSDDVRARFDIVGWDPRGVASSEPAVDCLDDLDAFVSADPSPDSIAEQQEQDAVAEEFADGCITRSGDILPYLATEYTARDMDAIRDALGDEKLTYFGYSYGTFLGAVYADLFPDRIRALVLDAAVDPSITAQDDSKNQAAGFESSLNAFLAACEIEPDCAFHYGDDPAAAYDALMAKLDTEPIYGDGTIEVGVGMAQLGVLSALYSESQWPALAEALAAAEAGDGSSLLELSTFITGRYGPSNYTDELEQRIAIACVDAERLTYDEKVALQAELELVAPRFSDAGVGPAGDPCDFWPVPSLREPKRITAPGSPPILVVGTTGDPATPYQQAVSLADQLSQGVLLTLNGERHTAYGGVSDCIDSAVDAYLIELIPPADATVCD